MLTLMLGPHACRPRGVQKSDEESQLTFRAVGAGLLVGSLLCCSNTYFGLQTGWVTMGSLQVPTTFLTDSLGQAWSAYSSESHAC